MSDSAIRLMLNGKETAVEAADLAALVVAMGLDSRTLVAEVNGVIVAAADFVATGLSAGDKVELVRFVGGG